MFGTLLENGPVFGESANGDSWTGEYIPWTFGESVMNMKFEPSPRSAPWGRFSGVKGVSLILASEPARVMPSKRGPTQFEYTSHKTLFRMLRPQT